MQQSTDLGSDEDDDDDDWETDDEQLVHVQLSGIFQDDLGRDPSILTRFVGLDTARPIVQIGDQVFEGKYSHIVGTSVFLRTAARDPERVDPVFDRLPSKRVEYLCKTNKKLTLKRVFLKRKQTEQAPPPKRASVDEAGKEGPSTSQ